VRPECASEAAFGAEASFGWGCAQWTDEPFSNLPEWGVGVLGSISKQFEGAYRIDLEPFHQDAFGLADVVTAGQHGFELVLAGAGYTDSNHGGARREGLMGRLS
jgi:hypothetical protein